MKFTLAVLPVALATTWDGWTDCGTADDLATLNAVKVTPDPPVKGTPLTFTFDMTLKEEIAAGSINLDLKAGDLIPIPIKETDDLCDQFKSIGESCPIPAGPITFSISNETIPKLIPQKHIYGNVRLMRDDSKQIACIDLDTIIKEDETIAAADDFDAYLNKFGKAYNGNDEYATRKAIYEENMKFIKAENAKGHSYTLGVGPFTDLTAEEFKATRLGYKKEESDSPVLDTHTWQGEELADSLDWTTKGAVTPVKDQGQCGSCWAFSTTGALESGYQLSSGQLVSLSEQQYVDCDGLPNLGCMGGQMSSALKWAEKHDICTESSYPYTAKGGLLSSCKSSGCSVGLKSGSVTGVKNLNSGSDADLKSALQQQPISIAIEADQNIFQHYTGGVITGSCGSNTDHGVLLVGYGTDSGNDYWKVKNSWGQSWGESGFVRLVQGKNQCGINSGPNYPVFSASVSV